MQRPPRAVEKLWQSRLILIAALIIIVLVLLRDAVHAEEQTAAPTAAPVAVTSTPEANRAELNRALADLQVQIDYVHAQGALTAEESENLARELERVYENLDMLSRRLAGEPQAGLPPCCAQNWQAYAQASASVQPAGATFSGWSSASSVAVGQGNYGELTLSVSNGGYQADWTIRDAYRGRARAEVASRLDGNIILSVTDDDGTHEFRVTDGGLGAIFVRGR